MSVGAGCEALFSSEDGACHLSGKAQAACGTIDMQASKHKDDAFCESAIKRSLGCSVSKCLEASKMSSRCSRPHGSQFSTDVGTGCKINCIETHSGKNDMRGTRFVRAAMKYMALNTRPDACAMKSGTGCSNNAPKCLRQI